jgi:hypothetical protein
MCVQTDGTKYSWNKTLNCIFKHSYLQNTNMSSDTCCTVFNKTDNRKKISVLESLVTTPRVETYCRLT